MKKNKKKKLIKKKKDLLNRFELILNHKNFFLKLQQEDQNSLFFKRNLEVFFYFKVNNFNISKLKLKFNNRFLIHFFPCIIKTNRKKTFVYIEKKNVKVVLFFFDKQEKKIVYETLLEFSLLESLQLEKNVLLSKQREFKKKVNSKTFFFFFNLEQKKLFKKFYGLKLKKSLIVKDFIEVKKILERGAVLNLSNFNSLNLVLGNFFSMSLLEIENNFLSIFNFLKSGSLKIFGYSFFIERILFKRTFSKSKNLLSLLEVGKVK